MAQLSNLTNLLNGPAQAAFLKQYNETAVQWSKIATKIQSGRPSEDYPWLSDLPAMREWTDERQPAGLKEYSFTITNATYEATLGIKRTLLEDDQLGSILIRVQQLAQEAARHTDQGIIDKLIANPLCYDGQNFIDTDHSEEASGSQSNKGTTALSLAEFGVARAAMMQFKGSSGKILGQIGNLLLVPPQLEQTAREITGADYVSDGTTTVQNMWKGTAEVMVSPYLTDTNNWYLMNTSDVVKPLIFQSRTNVEFTPMEQTSDDGFMRDTYYYGVRERKGFGVGNWRSVYGEIVA